MNKPTLRSDPPSSWLHLGASAFFRAHQAYYLNLLHQLGDTSWEMHLGNIRNSSSQDLLQQLKSQNGTYTLEVISPDGEISYQSISCVKNIILWNPSISNTIEIGIQKNTKIISFTVTETGYYLTDQGSLDLCHPSIQNDLNAENEVETLYGALYPILNERMHQNAPITLLSCDNLRNNGDSFRQGLIDFVKAKNNEALLLWLSDHVATPNSMVDRITPKFDESTHARMKSHGQPYDVAPVTCEHYSRWVIQNKFADAHPSLARVGVEFVKDVAPYEEAKIRLLNASHSGLAWMGALTGYSYIHEVLKDQYIKNLIQEYSEKEVAFALKSHGIEIDTAFECKGILNRFRNPYVKDTVARVSSDSISKLHGFIVPTIKDCLNQNKIPHAALKIVALYFLFLEKAYRQALTFAYEDREFETLDLEAIFTSPSPEIAFTQTEVLFGSLTTKAEFQQHLVNAIQEVKHHFFVSRQENNEDVKNEQSI